MAQSGVECVLCSRRFSISAVEDGEYCLETMVCFYCYAEMQAKSHNKSCFGKPPAILMPTHRRVLGYNENSRECQTLCPDRIPCRKVVLGLERE